MHKGINSTTIALIPKSKNQTTIKDFRPISLCSIAYKCISKIMANRLKIVLPSIVNVAQSAFVKGRNISDNILLAQELFRGYSRENGTPKCALKIDLYKAFDSISWEFLIQAMHRVGFPTSFTNLVSACISTPMYSVKINGAIHGYFQGNKGLRQGDPMSPYLFTIGMNVLSALLNQTPSDFSYHWKCKSLKLSHLFFADDVLLFSKGDKPSTNYTCFVLMSLPLGVA